MAVISHTSSAGHGDASSSIQDVATERVLETKPRVKPWGPSLVLNNQDIYPILEEKWDANVKLGASFKDGAPSPKRLRTDDIPANQAPLPPIRGFAAVGVVGGMGPEATLDLEKKMLTAAFDAGKPATDQDHLPMVILNLPMMIPDRTTYLNSFTGNRDNPEEWRAHLLKDVPGNPYNGALLMAEATVAAGAHFLVFPCNTFHAYYDVMAEKLKVPLLHIAEATMWALKKGNLDPDKPVALLATDGTIASKLYQTASQKMESYGCPQIKWVLPSPASQKEHIMKGIYQGVKAGDVALGTELMDKGIKEIASQHGISAAVEGCTEIPIALKDKDYGDIKLVDPTQALAEMAVEFSRSLARLERKYA